MNIDHVNGMIEIDIRDEVLDETMYDVPLDVHGYIVKDVDGDHEFIYYFDMARYVFTRYTPYLLLYVKSCVKP